MDDKTRKKKECGKKGRGQQGLNLRVLSTLDFKSNSLDHSDMAAKICKTQFRLPLISYYEPGVPLGRSDRFCQAVEWLLQCCSGDDGDTDRQWRWLCILRRLVIERLECTAMAMATVNDGMPAQDFDTTLPISAWSIIKVRTSTINRRRSTFTSVGQVYKTPLDLL